MGCKEMAWMLGSLAQVGRYRIGGLRATGKEEIQKAWHCSLSLLASSADSFGEQNTGKKNTEHPYLIIMIKWFAGQPGSL